MDAGFHTQRGDQLDAGFSPRRGRLRRRTTRGAGPGGSGVSRAVNARLLRRAGALPGPRHRRARSALHRYIIFNTAIRRLHIGTSLGGGTRLGGVGRYLVWSDIPGSAQMRWIERA
jgi:hypothetical protein